MEIKNGKDLLYSGDVIHSFRWLKRRDDKKSLLVWMLTEDSHGNIKAKLDGITVEQFFHIYKVEDGRHAYVGTFVKADGEKRTMKFMAYEGLIKKGNGPALVWDLEKKGLRCFNFNTLVGTVAPLEKE